MTEVKNKSNKKIFSASRRSLLIRNFNSKWLCFKMKRQTKETKWDIVMLWYKLMLKWIIICQ